MTTYTPHGTNAELDEEYNNLAVLEDKEVLLIQLGKMDMVKDVRAEMLPIKAQINKMEGWTVYEEATQ